MHSVSLALFLSLIATFCFGAATFLSSKSAKDMGALKTLFLFQLFGIPVFFFLMPFAAHITHVNWMLILLPGVFQAFLMLIWFYALNVGEVSVVSPVSEAYLLVSVLLGVIFLHESFGVLKILGVGLVFIGVILLGLQLQKLQKTNQVKLYRGIAPALLYAGGLAFFFLFTTFSARVNGWFLSALGIRVVIVVVTFCLLLLQRKGNTIFTKIPWKWIVSAGLLDAFGFAFFTFALTFSEVSYVTVIVSAQSLVTVILAYIFFKEKLQTYQWVGLFFVILGLVSLQLQ